jgi:hypothetical protein
LKGIEMRIEATYDLVIELIPGDSPEDSVLLLTSTSEDDEEQNIVIMLDEVEPLRQALAEGAAKLARMVGASYP